MIYYIAAWFFVISMQIEGENQASGLIMRPCHSTSGSGKKEKTCNSPTWVYTVYIKARR
jgi:hypothetical protein